MISVIIPTYKSPDALNLCLGSAIEGQYNKNQIIVVVDGFYDLNKEVLEYWSEYIDVLNLEENVGLCRGTNLGVYNASYDKILIVNDDNVFPNEWDVKLNGEWKKSLEKFEGSNIILSPNQIEPTPSMFPQFHIKDLGKDINSFDKQLFWKYEKEISTNKIEETGSTLPIFMKKLDYIKLGGWDENYELGMVADWDFFLKCFLSNFKMVRTQNCSFYHFASLSTNGDKRLQAERKGHEYAKYKWGGYIKHNPTNNSKYL